MSRKDNDSLEDFFRKATHQHDVEYNEADWKKLERMLDEQQPMRPVGWFRAHGRKALAGLAVAAVVATVFLLLPERQTTDAVPESAAVDTDPDVAATPQPQEKDRSLELRAGNEHGVDDAVRTDAVPPTREESASKPSAPITPRIEVASAEHVKGSRRAQDASENPVALEPNLAPEEDLSADHADEISDVSGFNHKQIEVPAPVIGNETVPGAEEQVAQMQDQPVDSASAEQTADAPEAPTRKRTSFDETRSRFGITVVAAPDFSMTPGGGSMGTGDAIGVYLHYQVLPRWGVTAGVLFDNKQYWGKGHEYRPPRGYWKALTNGVVPDRIDGTCSMYEVPVSITFDVLNTRRTRVFASAGLSSYFVRSEEYYYHFDTPNPGAVNGWTGKRPSTLWFGIGTLSAGFDFKATRTLSLGIEPYFKVPLEGMGWGDVDLYSTGVMFTARYHFAKRANKHPPTIQGP